MPAVAELFDKALVLASRFPDPPGGVGGAPGDPQALRRLMTCYYRYTSDEDLLAREPADVLGAVLSHRRLAAMRPQGTAAVRASTPAAETHGWSVGHTVVEVVTDDMPFLVDSVTAELARGRRDIFLIVHPQLRVRRDITGRLIEVLDDDLGAPSAPDVTVESWIHLEVSRETDPQTLSEIDTGLRRVLNDVREAVEDWPKMRRVALALAAEMDSPLGPDPEEAGEAQALLRWLAEDHFTFLGYREYQLVEVPAGDVLRVVPGTGLGLLRADPTQAEEAALLPPTARAREPRLLVLTKTNARSTVHRNVHLDYVGVKSFDPDGRVVGERRFLGLFTGSAYTESVLTIPVVRRTVHRVLEDSGLARHSHSGRDLLQILETYPRDDLFQIDPAELLPVAMRVLHLQERRQTRLFLRRDPYGRFVTALIYLPRDRYTTDARGRITEILTEMFTRDGTVPEVEYTAWVSESVLARLHFGIRWPTGTDTGLLDVDVEDLERRVAEATRFWEDDFTEALLDQMGEEEAVELGPRYAHAFSDAYKEDFSARTAVADLRRLESLGPDHDMEMTFYSRLGSAAGQRRFKLFRTEAVSLTRVLPILQRMGVEVVDERPYEVRRADGARLWVYDFGLSYLPEPVVAEDRLASEFRECFAAVWYERAESDGLNALVMRAGLSWRQVSMVRAYAKYLRQTGSTFSQEYLEQALNANVSITRDLVSLFEARFDPARRSSEVAVQAADAEASDLQVRILAGLDAVASLDQDRILRSFLAMVTATVRTNYFQHAPDGAPKPYISLKLDPQGLPMLPEPRPRHEIWVYSPRVEGVHLRFGAVARGGLRWSDRFEDFRTEILGLVKAQTVKNAVIVPTGAKGGFVVKPPVDPADREAWAAEGVACYRTLIAGLLDLTDNLVSGTVVPPPDVVRHDADDPYLVVAADKGTATFSDIANEISARYHFWLGDAFASGGSVGYDHKAMGITARGAWESVRRHFLELGLDTAAQDFTVVGVGDMSGDVFGNGMLRSHHIRLVAAFDHRHIMVDPDPDPEASWTERDRIFRLTRSSWADYDTSVLSAGGGVWPRTAKSIPVSPQARAALGIDEPVPSLTPAELMRAILRAPVDLFWNGGIGTYVKARTETHLTVGDKANDAIRVDGADLRVRVVAEGGNLGMTQLGRVEFALAGGRVNSDAIDNSAGVDTSDHEVNIKILLDHLVRAGDLTVPARNELLASMADEVAALVLRDNYEQNVVLSLSRAQAISMLRVYQRLIGDLEARGELDRALEFLPGDAAVDARAAAGVGLSTPELSVLLAYVKNTLTERLLGTDLADQAWFARALAGYFPTRLRERFGDRLAEHRLRREIITTAVVNDMVNRAGMTFAFRAQEETGAGPAEVARAYTVCREIFGLDRLWADIESFDARVPPAAQIAMYLDIRRLLDRATRWLLQARHATVDVAAEIARFEADLADLAPRVPDLLRGEEAERLQRRVEELLGLGAPRELAVPVAGLLDAFSLLDVVELAQAHEAPAGQVAELYFALSERFGVDRLLVRITGLPRADRWQALARSALRYDLYAALAAIANRVLTTTESSPDPDDRIRAWEEQSAEGLARSRATLAEIAGTDRVDIATLSVALRIFRTLVPAT
ncbi:MAG: NAD-glutamate dehydrogenase [Actinomycetes bacterium]